MTPSAPLLLAVPVTARPAVLQRARDAHAAPLLVILALAALLRLAWLGHAPLWGDEAATAAFAHLPWSELLAGIGRLEPNPPTFYAVEKLWTALAGSSDLALRLPAALCGIAGVAAVHAIARASFGLRAANWSAFLLAINPQHLEHARDARAYAALFLWVALAALAATRLTSLRPGQRLWPTAALLTLATAAALTLHYTATIATACVLVGAAVTALRRPAPIRPLIALATAGLVALLLATPVLAAMLAIAADPLNNASWIPRPNTFMAGLFVVSTWTTPYAAIRDAAPADGLRVMAVGALVVALVLIASAQRAARDPAAAGLLASSLTAVALMAGLSQWKPILVEQTFLFSLVFFLPLFGALLASLRRPVALATLAVLLLAQAPAFGRIYGPIRHNEDWTGLAADVQQHYEATGWPLIVRSGLDAITLQHVLPPDSIAGAALSITPQIGGQLSNAVANRLIHAKTLPADASPAALCAAIGAPGGVTLLVWRNALPQLEQHNAAALLQAAGGHLDGAAAHGILILQRWPGVCAPPAPTAPQ